MVSRLKKLSALALLAWLCAIALPLALLLIHQHADQLYPVDDEGNYFAQAQTIYRRLCHDGLWAALSHGYFQRGFRPVLQPFLGVPFLILSRGHALRAVSQAMFFSCALLLTHLYLLFREYLPRARAVVATALVGTLPWLLSNYFVFSSDASFLTCAIAAAFHAHRSELFTRARASAWLGFWVGLAICFRPVEGSFFVLGGPIAIYIALARRKRAVQRRDLLAALATAALTLLVFAGALARHRDLPLPAILVLGGLLLLPLLNRRRLKLSEPFVFAMTPALFLPAIWFAASVNQTFQWIYDCSFGAFIEMSLPRRIGALTFLGDIAWNFTGTYVAALLAAAAAAYYLDRRARSRPAWTPLQRALAWCALAALMIPPLIGSLGHNGEIRRYYIYGPMLGYSLVALALLRPGGRWQAGRVALLLAYIGFHSFFLTALTFEPELHLADRLSAIVPDPRWHYATARSSSLLVETFEGVAKVLPHGKPARVGVAFAAFDPRLPHFANPDSLTVLARERDEEWSFFYPWLIGTTDLPSRVRRVHEGLDWLLVGADMASPPEHPDERDAAWNNDTYYLARSMLQQKKSHSLERLGLVERWHNADFLLLEVTPGAAP